MKAIKNDVLVTVKNIDKEIVKKNLIYQVFDDVNPIKNIVSTATVYDSHHPEFLKGDKVWLHPNVLFGSISTKIDDDLVFSVANRDMNNISWSIYLIEREGVLIPTKRWTLIERLYIDQEQVTIINNQKIKLSKSGIITGLVEDKSVRMGKVFLSANSDLKKDDIIFYSHRIGEKLTINVNGKDYLRIRNPHFDIKNDGTLVEVENDILAIAHYG